MAYHVLQCFNACFPAALQWSSEARGDLDVNNQQHFYLFSDLLPSTLPPTCSGTHAAISPVTNPDDLSAMCSQVRSNLLYLTADNSD